MRYALKRRKEYLVDLASAANGVISTFINIRDILQCNPNEIAVCFNPFAYLAVSGGNADGDDIFQIVKYKGSEAVNGYIWEETIAAATLINGYNRKMNLPGDNWETDDKSGRIVVYPGERLYFAASAGGVGVIYTLRLRGMWFVYEEIPEELGKETQIQTPSPVGTPQRAGWWQ